MSYFLTEEQELIRNIARQFTEEEVKPIAMDIYGPESHKIIRRLGKRMGELGFKGIIAPEEFGGQAQPTTTLLIVMEEIAKECPALAVHLETNAVYGYNIRNIPEAAKKWWPKMISGDAILCIGSADPAGIGNLSEWSELAVPDGDEYVLNGTKHFTTDGPFADVLYIYGFCQGKLRAFVIDTTDPGVVISPEKKMGLGDTIGVTKLTNVRVHKSMSAELETNIGEGVFFLAYPSVTSLGLMEGVFEKTVAYLKERSNNGKPLAARADIQNQLAKMKAKIEILRCMIYDLARIKDEGGSNPLLGHLLKATMGDYVVDVARQCVSLWGGLGYCESTGIERYLRDAMGQAIACRTSEMHWSTAAYHMGLPDARP